MSDELELLVRLTDRTRKVVRLSAAFSKQFSHQCIEPQDLLDALAHMGGVSDYVLAGFGYVKKQAPKAIVDADRIIASSESLRHIVIEAHEQARMLGHTYVGTEHLLLAFAQTNPELLNNSDATRLEVLRLLGTIPEF